MVGSNVIGAKFWRRGEILFLKGWDLKLSGSHVEFHSISTGFL